MPLNRKAMDASLKAGGVMGAMGRLSLNDITESNQLRYPERPGEPDCSYFLRTGACAYGRNCRFNHPSSAIYDNGIKYVHEFPERVGEPDCGYYLRTGTCKYGATCKFNHPKDKLCDVWINSLGLPMRQDAKLCSFYMRTGVCKYGHSCKFHHPQPSSANLYYPLLSTPSYVTGSSLQQWQSYTPAFIYPQQDWSLYMGNVWPYSTPHVVNAQALDDQISEFDLPQRPDQPECRHFMNQGTCRYGSNCKYHHPREKMLQKASSSSNDLPQGCESVAPSFEPPRAGDSPDRNDCFSHSSVVSSNANKNESE